MVPNTLFILCASNLTPLLEMHYVTTEDVTEALAAVLKRT